MLPTVKDSSAFPISPETGERSSEIATAAPAAGSDKPVALEVPVTVNGARAVDGSEKREPFSETTNTVLVLAGGAVIRLASSVAPGQLLFLTNEKTRKEVICQVVKSKHYRNTSGYVELEFTEPVLGFWGMRFPGERHTAQNASLSGARKLDTGSLGGEASAQSVEAKPSSYADAKSVGTNVTSNLADAVQEFKTEIKVDARPQSKADLLAPAEPSIDKLKLEANRLQEQLSELLFDEQKQSEAKSSVPVALPSTNQPAAKMESRSSAPATPRTVPAAATTSFDDEQVKIPAWLEPLARNAAIPAPAADESESDSATETEGSQRSGKSEPIPSHKSGTGTARTAVATTAPGHTSAAPLFGNSLLDQGTPEMNKTRGAGSKGWMAVAAGIIIAATGGGWYFHDSLASFASLHTASGPSTSLASTAAPVTRTAAPPVSSAALAIPEPSVTVTKPNSASAPEAAAPVSSPAHGKVQTAAMTERIPNASSSNDIIKEAAKSEDVVPPESTKPSLGEIRLAKPKVRRSAKVQVNGELAPTLDDNNDALSLGDNSRGPNFAESSGQPEAPAAPVPVGGDVRPARLISPVSPAYPALAKAQHVAGDVRIDALIDANGRVTTMKVVSGPSLLHQAAMDALRRWKYQPATLDGKPVPMHLTVTLQFHLQ
jgi:TonB family protein